MLIRLARCAVIRPSGSPSRSITGARKPRRCKATSDSLARIARRSKPAPPMPSECEASPSVTATTAMGHKEASRAEYLVIGMGRYHDNAPGPNHVDR